jgi:hypothetical protein
VAFPERDTAVEETTEGLSRGVVAGQYQKRGLIIFENIYRPPVLTGKAIIEVLLSLVLCEGDPNAWRQAASKIDFLARLQRVTRFQSPAMLMIATPVILPSASKPNMRLAASPRGNTSFTL